MLNRKPSAAATIETMVISGNHSKNSVEKNTEHPIYQKNADGAVRVSKLNIMTALSMPSECGVKVRYDEFGGDIIWSKPNSEEWSLLNDNLSYDIALILESPAIGFPDIPTSKLSQAISSFASRNPVDTLVAWVDTLKWDGIPRVEKFLTLYLPLLP